MSKHLFVLLLIIAAVGTLHTPAHAATLTAGLVNCFNNFDNSFDCSVNPSGGSGTYTSFVWKVKEAGTTSTSTYITSTPGLHAYCTVGKSYNVSVTVTDSSGATATGSGGKFRCGGPPE